jgi:hypothetical protein
VCGGARAVAILDGVINRTVDLTNDDMEEVPHDEFDEESEYNADEGSRSLVPKDIKVELGLKVEQGSAEEDNELKPVRGCIQYLNLVCPLLYLLTVSDFVVDNTA